MSRRRLVGADAEEFAPVPRHRLLREVPELTAEDWAHVDLATLAYQLQLRLIVRRARQRATSDWPAIERTLKGEA